MSFIPTGTANTTNTAQGQAKEKRDPIAFVNLYVPLADGTRAKICTNFTFMLFAENAIEKHIMDKIKSGELSMEEFVKNIQVEVTPARDKNAPIELGF